MTYISYEDWNPSPATAETVRTADRIARQYAAQGYNLTLRQLYYRFVAQDLIPNRQSEYKRLGEIVNRARLSGRMSWDHIEDRTRNLRQLPTWATPESVMEQARRQYREDIWEDQPTAVEVWVEKDALIDVVARAANAWDAPHFSCRGYVSQSEMWRAGQRLVRRLTERGQTTLIIHLGDHDPSGIDMSRDIADRLETFVMGDADLWDRTNEILAAGGETGTPYSLYAGISGLPHPYAFHVRRIALTQDQIDTYDPPPNPAKLTDSRAAGYVAAHGYDSWELDALEPQVIDDLIQEEIAGAVDYERLEAARARQEGNRKRIREAIETMSL